VVHSASAKEAQKMGLVHVFISTPQKSTHHRLWACEKHKNCRKKTPLAQGPRRC